MEDPLLRRLAATQQTYADRLLKRQDRSQPTYYQGFDAAYGMPVVENAQGSTIVGRSITNGLQLPGQRVRVMGVGLRGAIDSMPRIQPVAELEQVVEESIGFYVADRNRIRFVDVGLEEVTTFAGALYADGPTYQDGPVLEARFNAITGIAYDAASDALYVSDVGNRVIRKIQNGQVTTIAGSPSASGYVDGVGDAARFNNPWYLALAPDGNLYVADSPNRVRRIDLSSGEVSTLAILDLSTDPISGLSREFAQSIAVVETDPWRLVVGIGVSLGSTGEPGRLKIIEQNGSSSPLITPSLPGAIVAASPPFALTYLDGLIYFSITLPDAPPQPTKTILCTIVPDGSNFAILNSSPAVASVDYAGMARVGERLFLVGSDSTNLIGTPTFVSEFDAEAIATIAGGEGTDDGDFEAAQFLQLQQATAGPQ